MPEINRDLPKIVIDGANVAMTAGGGGGAGETRIIAFGVRISASATIHAFMLTAIRNDFIVVNIFLFLGSYEALHMCVASTVVCSCSDFPCRVRIWYVRCWL